MTAPDLMALYDARVAGDHLRHDPAQRAVAERLQTLRAALEAPAPAPRRSLFGRARAVPAPRGVYLWGGVGRGKSMMMDLFHGALAIEGRRRVHFHAFMQEVHAGLHAARARGVQDALAPVAAGLTGSLRVLCLDEMQITDITDAMLVGRLFEALFEGGVAVVTTSNRPPEDLYKDGLNRQLFLPFIALIRDRLDVIELEAAEDYRQHRLQGAQVWFHPAGTGARAAIDALWRDLTGGARPEPFTLGVQGRLLTLPAFADGVARASFWELCGQPLGPADYLALAGAVRVLILDDIPRLGAGNYNEAKRFVTLVDTLYEARVRLVASAADAPELLYLEGAGSFEFERTASRLQEMQAADWANASPGAATTANS
ncbi:MAG: cell division protein ZapE [Alkalilacustris sp.]